MNYTLVVAGVLLIVTGSDLLYIHTPSEFLTPLGFIGYDILKMMSYTHIGEAHLTGIFLFVIGLIVVIIGSSKVGSHGGHL